MPPGASGPLTAFGTPLDSDVARPITFLSDYGADDEFAGVCRAVIARIAPEAHGDRPHPRRPRGTRCARGDDPGQRAPVRARPGVHLAVVDPGSAAAPRGGGPRGLRGQGAGGARQRAAVAGDRAPRRRGRGGRRVAVAAPARADLGDLPRPRHLRPGRRATWRGARRCPRPASEIARGRRWSRLEASRAARSDGPRPRTRALRGPVR